MQIELLLGSMQEFVAFAFCQDATKTLAALNTDQPNKMNPTLAKIKFCPNCKLMQNHKN